MTSSPKDLAPPRLRPQDHQMLHVSLRGPYLSLFVGPSEHEDLCMHLTAVHCSFRPHSFSLSQRRPHIGVTPAAYQEHSAKGP